MIESYCSYFLGRTSSKSTRHVPPIFTVRRLGIGCIMYHVSCMMYHSIVGPDTFQPVGPSEELLGQWRCWQWQGPWTFGAIWFLCDNPTIQRLSICRASTYVSSFLCHYHLGFFKDLGYHDYILRLDDDAFLCIVTNYLQYLWYGERKILCLPMNSPITNIFQIGGSDDILFDMNFGSWYQLQHLQRLEGVQYRPWWSHVQSAMDGTNTSR